MKVIDTHCDALLKLWESSGTLSYANAPELETNKERLLAGGVKVQFFAIFIPPSYPVEQKLQIALKQIDYFYTEVLGKNPEMKQITHWQEIDTLGEREIGAVLSLEGADAIGDDLVKLATLYRLGVRSLGITWNNANLCADGVGEVRGAGLTQLGREVVRFNNDHLLFTDVSHLSEQGFWDCLELAEFPIASHSNAQAICHHRRNLTDEQARALFTQGGLVGIVYYPPFISETGEAKLTDLLKHIEHFCSLGGKRHICLGSDFDGITSYVQGLEDAGQTQNLLNLLLKYYSEEVVRGFAYQNFLSSRPHLKKNVK